MRADNFLVIAVSTFFYIGYLPFIPGTFASIVAAYLFFLSQGSIALCVLFLILGFSVSSRAERLLGKKDPRYIVIDEICGMFLSLIFIPPRLPVIIAGWGLFRIMDTLKPYPIRKLECLPGSLGIMADDIMAGVYTNLLLQFILRIPSLRIS